MSIACFKIRVFPCMKETGYLQRNCNVTISRYEVIYLSLYNTGLHNDMQVVVLPATHIEHIRGTE